MNPGKPEWTVEALKEHIDTVATAMQRDVDRVGNETQRLRDEQSQFVRIDAYNERHGPLESRVGSLENWRANLMGRAVAIGLLGALLFAVIGAVLGHLIK